MGTFVLIDGQAYNTNTTEEIVAASALLHDAGEDCADIWTGDPEGDHHKNGQLLFARRSAASIATDVLAEVANEHEGILAAWIERCPVGWRWVPLLRGHRTASGYALRLCVLDAFVSQTIPLDGLSIERARVLMARAQDLTRIYTSDVVALARRFDDAGCRTDAEIVAAARRARSAVLAALPEAVEAA